MAEADISMDHGRFDCKVCLDLLNFPVVCRGQEDVKGIFSCPLSSETSTPRPVLHTMLSEVEEKPRETELEAALVDCYAAPGDVECDSCIGRKRKAVNSCLVCLTSYCKDHVKPHHQSPAFKKHKLVEACAELQARICSQHDKLIDIYCRTDQSFICYLCMMDEHKSHDTVSIKAERTEKQNELKKTQIKFRQRMRKKMLKARVLKQTMDSVKRRSQAAVDDSEKIVAELINSMLKKRTEMKELIRAQEKAELSQAERHLKQLEQEVADLKRRITDMEQLSHTRDHIHFLQSFPSLRVFSPGCDDSSNFTVNQNLSFNGVRKSLSDLKKLVEEICQEDTKLSLSDELYRREDFLQYFCHLTLDPDTAHHQLVLSEKNRAVTRSKMEQRCSDNPERFDCWTQVLCKECVIGRCYWEVERSGMGVDISVSYKEISRKRGGDECGFGYNSQSWSLVCSSSSVSIRHNNIKTDLRILNSSRIGVYVDHSAGTLSFYSVSDKMKLLHRVNTKFTQPLYAGFKISYYYSTIRLCDPN